MSLKDAADALKLDSSKPGLNHNKVLTHCANDARTLGGQAIAQLKLFEEVRLWSSLQY